MSVDRGALALELCGDQGQGISTRIVIDNIRPSKESRAWPREDSELCSSVSMTQMRKELYSDLSQHTGKNNLVQNMFMRCCMLHFTRWKSSLTFILSNEIEIIHPDSDRFHRVHSPNELFKHSHSHSTQSAENHPNFHWASIPAVRIFFATRQ